MKTKQTLLNWFITAGLIFIIMSCNNNQKASPNPEETAENEISRAVCVLHPTKDNTAGGVVTFTKTDVGIKVVADLYGLSAGKHGFHIHEYGDCTNLEGASAGGHFNPENKQHGAPIDASRHVGDLGNVVAGEDGKAHYEWIDTKITFSGKNSIIGRGIIVHANEDDFISQPTGNAGARVACGVIGIAK